MSEQPPIVDAELGTLVRATTELDDGTILEHGWYAGTVPFDGAVLGLMVEGTTPDRVSPLLPRVREIVSRLDTLQRLASDAVVSAFSTGDPEPQELEDAATDLTLETLEASADGVVVLHFIDSCGAHFPDGFWPSVHLGADDLVERVTVES